MCSHSDCTRGYFRLREARNHECDAHGIVHDVYCPVCLKDFANTALMKTHIEVVHKDYFSGDDDDAASSGNQVDNTADRSDNPGGQAINPESQIGNSECQAVNSDSQFNKSLSGALTSTAVLLLPDDAETAHHTHDVTTKTDIEFIRDWLRRVRRKLRKCAQCGMQFDKLSTAQIHRSKAHTEGGSCSICGKGWYCCLGYIPSSVMPCIVVRVHYSSWLLGYWLLLCLFIQASARVSGCKITSTDTKLTDVDLGIPVRHVGTSTTW